MGFIIQRFHQLMRPGRYLGAVRSKLAVHSQQSRWDSACALHCAVMVLQIAGLINDPSEVATGRRRLEAKILRKAAEVFLKGMTFPELAAFIDDDLACGLRTKVLARNVHRNAVAFVERELARGQLVICSVRAVGDTLSHAVLAIGVEGILHGGRFEAHAFLILDPTEGPPAAFATCNTRLYYGRKEAGGFSRYGTYQTLAETFSVVLNGAVSVDVGEPKKPP